MSRMTFQVHQYRWQLLEPDALLALAITFVVHSCKVRWSA